MCFFIKKAALWLMCIFFLFGCSQSKPALPDELQERSSVSAFWLDELEKLPVSTTEYIADSYSEQAKVILLPDGKINDLKLQKLEFQDITEDGHIVYMTEEVFSPDVFTKERPLILGITFFGAIPNYGISYQDNYGDLHHFALQISGENGSILMLPF